MSVTPGFACGVISQSWVEIGRIAMPALALVRAVLRSIRSGTLLLLESSAKSTTARKPSTAAPDSSIRACSRGGSIAVLKPPKEPAPV
jgi:hypothetical protein